MESDNKKFGQCMPSGESQIVQQHRLKVIFGIHQAYLHDFETGEQEAKEYIGDRIIATLTKFLLSDLLKGEYQNAKERHIMLENLKQWVNNFEIQDTVKARIQR